MLYGILRFARMNETGRVRMDGINFNEKTGFICDMDGVIYH